MFLNDLFFVYSTNDLLSNTGNSKISQRINEFSTQITELFTNSCKCAKEIIESYEHDLVTNTDQSQKTNDKDKTFISTYKNTFMLKQEYVLAQTLIKVLEIEKLSYSFDKNTSKDEYSGKIFREIDVLFTFGRKKFDDLKKNIEDLELLFNKDTQTSENTKSKIQSFKETNNKSIKQLTHKRKECKTNVEKVIQEIYGVNSNKKEEPEVVYKKKESEVNCEKGESEKNNNERVTESTDDKKEPEKNGLSVTKIIFFVAGVLLGVVIISVLLYFLLIKKNTTNEYTELN